jgi:putative transposase
MARSPPTSSKRRWRTSNARAQSLPRCTRTSCRTSSCAWSGRIKPSFAVCRQADRQPGYPRFQGRTRYNGFTFPEYANGATLHGGVLLLSKIGRISIRLQRPLEGTPKTVTVSHVVVGWYACFSCADVPIAPLPPTGQETGIDVGLKVFLITADGESVENPRHYRTAERTLSKAQRRVSRRKKGSKRRHKGVALLKRAHQHVQRQRRDFHHKTALRLRRTYDTIYLEDLRVANMGRNHSLAKRISDAGWTQLRIILEAKAACAGRRVIAVPPAYTSQDCSGVLPDGSRCTQRVAKSRCAPTSAPTVGWSWIATRTPRSTFCGPGRPVRRQRGGCTERRLRSPWIPPWGACHTIVLRTHYAICITVVVLGRYRRMRPSRC